VRISSVRIRQQIITQLAEWGPQTSVAALQLAFPQIMRAELDDLLSRFRRIHRHRLHRRLAHLQWQRVGAVWAGDFAFPPTPVEERYPRLLSVRDLASGQHLLWRPIADETSATAAAILEGMFREHGAPLVLKVDNGSAWRGQEVQTVLMKWMVWMLFSPPLTPEYNGSSEAGIGAAKGRTHERSERRGDAGNWSWDDIEGARLDGNHFGSSPLFPNQTPEQVWETRQPILTEERAALQDAVNRIEKEVQEERAGRSGEAVQEAPSKEGIMRAVLSRALRALGLLVIRWGRFITGVSEPKEDKIP
jgi:hypothetical protein